MLDWCKLVEASELFSGGDILVTVKNALFDAARMTNPALTTEIVLSAIKDWRLAKNNIGQWEESTVEIVTKKEENKEEVAI